VKIHNDELLENKKNVIGNIRLEGYISNNTPTQEESQEELATRQKKTIYFSY
jgi:hypothetical protein